MNLHVRQTVSYQLMCCKWRVKVRKERLPSLLFCNIYHLIQYSIQSAAPYIVSTLYIHKVSIKHTHLFFSISPRKIIRFPHKKKFQEMQLSKFSLQPCKNYRIGEYIFFAVCDIVWPLCRSALQQWYLLLKTDISLLVCETAKVMEPHACGRCFLRKDGTLMDWKVW